MNRRALVKHATAAVSVVAFEGISPRDTSAQTPETTPSTTLYGNAFDLIPDGQQETVQVVTVGKPSGETVITVPFVGRNRTDATIGLNYPWGTGYDPAGNVVAELVDGKFVPYLVGPGGIFIGYSILDIEEIPVDARLEFDLDYYVDPDPPVLADYTVTEAEVSDTHVTGVLTNASAWPITGGGYVWGLFFDSAGAITGQCYGLLDSVDGAIGESFAFTAAIDGEPNSDRYLLGAAGNADVTSVG